MADHSKPVVASAYATFVSEMDARFDEITQGLDPAFSTPTNLPVHALRFSSAAGKWQRFNGTTWVDPVATYAIAVSGNAGSVTNGLYNNESYANPVWITSLAGAKITGDISGNAGTATTLQNGRTINGVSFNGSANISVNANNNVTFSNAGTGAASGVTYNGGAAATISYNTVGAPSTGGAGATGTWVISISGNAATASALTTSAMNQIYPVGSIYFNAANNTNPATLLGFGTWVAFGAGRVPVGFNASDPLFDTAEETGGSKDATVVSHTHTATITDNGHVHNIPQGNQAGGGGGSLGSGDDYTNNVYSYVNSQQGFTGISVGIGSTGSSGTNANLQPYITVYMWKRTA